MSNERIGDSRLIFGCTDEPWGYMQALTENNAVDESEAMDGKGNVAAVEQFNRKQAVTGTYLYYAQPDDDPLSEVGTGVSIPIADLGISIYVKSTTKNYSVGAWHNVNFEGTLWPYLRNS